MSQDGFVSINFVHDAQSNLEVLWICLNCLQYLQEGRPTSGTREELKITGMKLLGNFFPLVDTIIIKHTKLLFHLNCSKNATHEHRFYQENIKQLSFWLMCNISPLSAKDAFGLRSLGKGSTLCRFFHGDCSLHQRLPVQYWYICCIAKKITNNNKLPVNSSRTAVNRPKF